MFRATVKIIHLQQSFFIKRFFTNCKIDVKILPAVISYALKMCSENHIHNAAARQRYHTGSYCLQRLCPSGNVCPWDAVKDKRYSRYSVYIIPLTSGLGEPGNSAYKFTLV